MKSYVFGRFMVEGRLQRLVHDGRIVPLKPKAYDLLCVLLARRDQVLGKDELLDWLWPRQDVGEANLTQTVYELRQALGESASEPRWIETVPRRGYRFKGSVLERTQKPAPGAPDSLAVLPFRPLTSQPEIRELGLGIADAIILSLSATRRAVVRPLSAVLPYANSEQDTLAIGRLLDVDTVLEGTVQQFGNRLRVSSRLLTCPAGEDLWSSTRETGVDDLFATQDVIARQAADAVAGHLEYERPGPPLSPHGANHDVHALYLKARFCWQRWVPEASRQALEYLDEAVALDPAHAPSHAWRAAAWSTLGILGAEAPRIVAENARAAARQAVELDPSLSEGHEMLGAVQLFFDWDLNAAARSLDLAIELNPSSANARHLRALALAVGGSDPAALAEMVRALRADPSSLIANSDVGMLHYWGRRYAEAKHWFETTLEQDPGFAHARSGLAFTLLEMGEADGAVEEMTRAAEHRGRMGTGELAHVLGRAGRRDEAGALVQKLLESNETGAVDPYQLVLAFLGLADYGRTIEWLGRAVDYRSRDLVLLGVSPIVDPLREDARFQNILQKLGLA